MTHCRVTCGFDPDFSIRVDCDFDDIVAQQQIAKRLKISL
jgi:hypothetical protein